MLKFIDLVILTLFCTFIYWLSNQSSLPNIQVFEWQDKVHHMGAYFMMAVFAWRAFRHYVGSLRMLAAVTVVFCSLYGMTDEVHQYFVPGRSSDVWDWVADTLGASLSVAITAKIIKRRHMLNA